MLQKANLCIKHRLPCANEKFPSFWLSFPFVLGLVFGALCACSVDIPVTLPLTQFIAVSFPGSLLISCFPFVLSIVLNWIWGPEALVPVAFIEAFRSTFFFGALIRFNPIGWVLHLVPCFLDFFRLPALVLFWSSLYRDPPKPRFLFCIALYLLFICTVFYDVILPFWAQQILA